MNRAIASSTYKPWRFKIIPIKDIFWTLFGFLIFIPIELADGLFLAYFQILVLFFLSKKISTVKFSIFSLYCLIVVLSITLGDEIRIASIINPILIGMALLVNIRSKYRSEMIIKGIYISAIAHTFLLMYIFSTADITTLYGMLTQRDWASDVIPYFGNGLAMSFAVSMLFAAKDRNWKLLLILFIGGVLTTSRVPIFSVVIISFFFVARSISLKNLINIIFIGFLVSFTFITLFTNYNLAEQVEGILNRFTYASDRNNVYLLAISEIVENPILGAGSKKLEYYYHAHNSFLQVAYRYGIFAFCLWFFLIYLSLLRGLMSLKYIEYILVFVLISFFQIGLLNPCIVLMIIIFRQFWLDQSVKVNSNH
jgi:hypothetical protein